MTKRNRRKVQPKTKRSQQGHRIVNPESSSREAILALRTHETPPVKYVSASSGDAVPSSGGATFLKSTDNRNHDNIVNKAIDDESPTGGFRDDSQQIHEKLEAFDNKIGLSIENSEYRAESKLENAKGELKEKISEAKHSLLKWLITICVAIAGICISVYFATKSSFEAQLSNFEKKIEKNTETKLSNFESKIENKLEKRILSIEKEKKKPESEE